MSQFSMLSSAFETLDLAQVIHDTFEKELNDKLAENPASTDLPFGSSVQTINGVIQACQD